MIALYLIFGFIVILLIANVLIPSKIRIEKSILIDAPVEKVFGQMNELKNWKNWSVWYQLDPEQKIQYSKKSHGEGAWYTWESKNKKVGKGKMTLFDVEQNQQIKQKLEFEKWGENTSVTFFEPEKGETKITWIMEEEFKGMMKFIAPYIKNQLSRSFNQNLANIKSIAESK